MAGNGKTDRGNGGPVDTRTLITIALVGVLAGGTGGIVGNVPQQIWADSPPAVASGALPSQAPNSAALMAQAIEAAQRRDNEILRELTAATREIAAGETWRRERQPVIERFDAIDRELDSVKRDIGALDDKYLTIREAEEIKKGIWSRMLRIEDGLKALGRAVGQMSRQNP